MCRPETYRIKLLVYRSLIKFTSDLKRLQDESNADTSSTNQKHIKPSTPELERDSSPLTETSSRSATPFEPTVLDKGQNATPLAFSLVRQQIAEKVCSLVAVYDKILKEEHPGDVQCDLRRLSNSPDDLVVARPFRSESDGSTVPPILAPNYVPSCLICDFCGGDIFQSFFECKICHTDSLACGQKVDNIVICPGCYVEGRSCSCTFMTPVQNYALQILLKAQNDACDFVNKELWRSPAKLIPLSHQ